MRAPAHDDAGRGLADLVQGNGVAGKRLVLHPVDRRVHDRVRQRQVLAGDHLLVVDEVVVTFLVLALRTEPRAALACEPGEGDVHVVGRSPHEPDGLLGDATKPAMTSFQIVDRAGDHVADVDGLARLGVRHQAVVGELLLDVEDPRQAAGRTLQLRVGRDVVDTFAAEPDLAIASTQALQRTLPRFEQACGPPNMVVPPHDRR